jgi:polysaccharide biosynthesis PFTS motif protein
MLGAVSEPAIAIFDVSPVRDALYWPLGVNVEYYVPSVVNRFLEDVYDAANALGITVLYKRKRDHKRFHHPKYERQCASMRQRTRWHEVDASISAFRVIDMVDMVISLPFTSTALIGVAQGKPSIYYDPTGEMCTDDRAALGVPILTNKDDLRNWMEDTLLGLSY